MSKLIIPLCLQISETKYASMPLNKIKMVSHIGECTNTLKFLNIKLASNPKKTPIKIDISANNKKLPMIENALTDPVSPFLSGLNNY